jgi:hypothetical protein
MLARNLCPSSTSSRRSVKIRDVSSSLLITIAPLHERIEATCRPGNLAQLPGRAPTAVPVCASDSRAQRTRFNQ